MNMELINITWLTDDLKVYNWGDIDISATIDNYDSILRFGEQTVSWNKEEMRTWFEAYTKSWEILITETLLFTRRALELTHSSIEEHKNNWETIYNSDWTIDFQSTKRYKELRSRRIKPLQVNSEILTWYEVSNEDGELDLNDSMEFINLSMRNRSPHKYWDFMKKTINGRLKKAMFVMWLPDIKKRLDLFQNVYFAMRLLDDIIDWDSPITLSDKEREELLSALNDLSEEKVLQVRNPLLRWLFVNILQLSWELWFPKDMIFSVLQIIKSMKFDDERIHSEEKIIDKQRLDNNFHLMDIVGTIGWTAIIFWIEPEQAKKMLTPLWEACRLIYNLQDFYEDVWNDIINISSEDLKKFNITDVDLEFVRTFSKEDWKIKYLSLPQSIKKWFQQEISKIHSLINKHKDAMEEEFFFTCWGFWKFREWVMKKQIIPKTYLDEIERDSFVISRLVA